jgi:hypothetical protein
MFDPMISPEVTETAIWLKCKKLARDRTKEVTQAFVELYITSYEGLIAAREEMKIKKEGISFDNNVVKRSIK